MRPAVEPASVPLEVSIARLSGEPVPPERAAGLEFEACQVGCGWGGPWATAWFRGEGRVPASFAGHRVVARVDLGYQGQAGFGGEALLFEGTRPIQGVNARHSSIDITSRAEGGEPVRLLLEAAANPSLGQRALEWPLLMPDYDASALYRLARFDLAIRDDEMAAVDHDWTVLLQLVDALGLDHPLSVEVVLVLDAVARGLDLSDVQGTVGARRAEWAPLLEVPAGAGAREVVAVGHAHIDSAWLWPVRETRRKCARTFSTALRLRERYPEYVFVCSQAQQHAWVEQDYPELFEEMRLAVAAGAVEPVGSMWVEPDTNVPSGESLARQLSHGKGYFLDRYGVETTDCWLPDAFGYSGALPQILRAAGVSRFFTQKLSWNDTTRFPHHTFWWEGIDGSRVLAHCPPTNTYNGLMTVGELLVGEAAFAQHGLSRRSLYCFGHGDGGGGPTEEMLERARRVGDMRPLPSVRLGTVRGFFDALEGEIAESERRAEGRPPGRKRTAHFAGPGGLPVWAGELYLEYHRGVQTTRGRGKLGNRRSEALLREAELFAAAGLEGASADEAAGKLRTAWELTLLQQFHDILPGSSIHWVNEESDAAYEEIAALAESVIAAAARSLSARRRVGTGSAHGSLGALLVLNATSRPRSAVAELRLADAGVSSLPAGVVDGTGAHLPVQPVAGGNIAFPVALPGCGWEGVELSVLPAPPGALSHPAAVSTDGRTLSNGLVSVTLDDEGLLSSLVDLERDREVIERGRAGNVFQLHEDLPDEFDAWNVDPGTFEEAIEDSPLESVEVVEEGPVRAAIRVERRLGAASRVVQDVRVAAGSRMVEFRTEVDWQERHRMLKVAFPVTVRAPRAAYEIQFGHLERPTHANTPADAAQFEVPAQRWADLYEPGFGVALLNDCKHGYDVRRNVMRLSLLRAPGWPDPVVDRGRHHFSYALLPHSGPPGCEEVLDAAEALNLPPRIVPCADPAIVSLPSGGFVVRVEGAAVSAVKRADDGSGDLVVRIYEHLGASRRAVLAWGTATSAGRAFRVDLLERRLEPVDIDPGGLHLDLRPFELVTLRIEAAARSWASPGGGRGGAPR